MSVISRSFLPVVIVLICTSQVSGQTITSFNPTFGSAFDFNFIDVFGSGFAPGTVTLKFGNTVDPTAGATSTTHIQARVPTNAPLGPCLISVSLNGVPPAFSTQSFTIIGRGPFVTNFSPFAGSANTTVTVGGAHFAGVTNVSFNGKPGTGLVVALDYSLTVNAPNGVTTGPITVIGTNGFYTTTSNLYVPPVITGFSPAAGRTGTNVLLMGINFLGTTAIFFGAISTTNFTVLSNNAVRVTVPDGAQTGKL